MLQIIAAKIYIYFRHNYKYEQALTGTLNGEQHAKQKR